MHLSQAEGHAVISVKSCDRKSIALRKAHGKATALSLCSAFCFLLPSLHRDRAAWTHVWVLLTLCLGSSGTQSMGKAGSGDGEQGGRVRQGIGSLTGFGCLQTPSSHSIPALLCSSETLPTVPQSSFTLLCALMCASTASPLSTCPHRAGHPGRMIWPSSSRLWNSY